MIEEWKDLEKGGSNSRKGSFTSDWSWEGSIPNNPLGALNIFSALKAVLIWWKWEFKLGEILF